MIDSVSDMSSQRGNTNNSNEAIQVIQLNAQHAKQAQLNINNWIDYSVELINLNLTFLSVTKRMTGCLFICIQLTREGEKEIGTLG